MRVVVINLDRSPERLESFREQAEQLGIAFERLAAVDGRTIREPRGRLTPSEIACFESHRLAWKSLVDSGQPWLAVFEDDVILAPPIAEFLAHPERFPADADVIKLETFTDKIVISRRRVRFRGYALHRMLSRHRGCAGYLVSRRAAVRLLERTADFWRPIDVIVFDPKDEATRDLRILQAVPALCIQEQWLAEVEKRPLQIRSLIEHSRATASTIVPIRPQRGKIRREVGRVLRQLADHVSAPGRIMTRNLIVPFFRIGRLRS